VESNIGGRQLNPAPVESDDRQSSDLAELVETLWVRRLWIAGSGMLVALLAAGAGFLMTPIYRASTVLVPADSDRSSLGGALGSALGTLGGFASLADIGIGSTGAATEEALAVLRSRQFADEFIADKQLMQIIYASKWDSGAGQWIVPPGDRPTAAKTFQYFDRNIRSVTQDKKTGLVTLQIDWKDPQLAAAWANELVQRLNLEMKRRALSQADASIGYLEKELASTNVLETRSAINRLIETQINRRMVANVSEQFAFRVVDRAVPADFDDVVRPKKLVMILIGGCLGLLISSVVVLLTRSRFAVKTARELAVRSI
jgi:uncharacterized protein involved in exopolysaccharide biosynthesis